LMFIVGLLSLFYQVDHPVQRKIFSGNPILGIRRTL
jgi:hypothetical protein